MEQATLKLDMKGQQDDGEPAYMNGQGLQEGPVESEVLLASQNRERVKCPVNRRHQKMCCLRGG